MAKETPYEKLYCECMTVGGIVSNNKNSVKLRLKSILELSRTLLTTIGNLKQEEAIKLNVAYGIVENLYIYS